MFVAGRHYFLNVHITTQYPKAIPPRIRDNADYVFLFRASGPANREKLYDDFGSGLTKEEFFVLLNRYTQDNFCLVFRNRRPEKMKEKPGSWGGTQTAPVGPKGGKPDTHPPKLNVEIDERGRVMDPRRFDDYFFIRYPFPIPEFRMGDAKEWAKQDEDKAREAFTLRLHYQGFEVGDLATKKCSVMQDLRSLGAGGYMQKFLKDLESRHSETWGFHEDE
jgi:hypothetical protein